MICKLNPDSFGLFAEQIRTRVLASGGIVAVLALLIVSYTLLSRGESPLIVLFANIFTSAMMWFVFRSVLRNTVEKQRISWNSFQLIVQDDRITRKQEGLQDITICRSEVTKIKETSQCLFVQTRSKLISVPHNLDGYEQLRSLIGDWQPVMQLGNANMQTTASIGNIVIGLVFAGAYFAALFENQKLFALPLCVLVVGGGIYSAITILRSPNSNAEVRRMGWFMIIPLLPVAIKLIFLLK